MAVGEEVSLSSKGVKLTFSDSFIMFIDRMPSGSHATLCPLQRQDCLGEERSNNKMMYCIHSDVCLDHNCSGFSRL